MTTTQAASKAASPVATTELSEERAASIGWYFINSYYDFYNNNVDAIHRIYKQNAAVSHAGFPSKGGRVIHKAQGLDAIKARFALDDLKASNNRIIITSAAFEVSLQKNILIVAFGEWSRNDSPYYQFTQTFVLTPGKKENTFDVANDVLRFVDYEEFKDESEYDQEKEKPTEKVTEPKKTAEVTKEETPKLGTPKPEVETKPLKAESLKPESKSESSKPESKSESSRPESSKSESSKSESSRPESSKSESSKTDSSRPESSKSESSKTDSSRPETSSTKSDSRSESSSSRPESSFSSAAPKAEPEPKAEATGEPKPTEANTPRTSVENSPAPSAGSGAPMSWAALASQSAGKPVTPIKAPAPKPVKKPAPPKSKNGKGEGFYPIYMRGVGPLESEKVSAYLAKHFGPVKVFNKSDKIALVEFTNAEGQEKAIAAKEGTIDGTTFTLEPRESKNSYGYGMKNGYTQSNFKKFKDVRKDKVGLKKKPRD